MSLGFRGVKIAAGEYYADDNNGSGSFVASNVPSDAAGIWKRFGREVLMMINGYMDNWPDMETGYGKAAMNVCEEYDHYSFEEPFRYNAPWGYAEFFRSTTVTVAG